MGQRAPIQWFACTGSIASELHRCLEAVVLNGSWLDYLPGKVVVGLSINSAVEALLQRIENVVSRQTRHAPWQLAPFPEQQTPELQQRILLAPYSQLAAPWDPDGDYQWQPATCYSRLLRHKGDIVGWLIAHFCFV